MHTQILRGSKLCQCFLHRENLAVFEHCSNLVMLAMAPLPRLRGTICRGLSIQFPPKYFDKLVVQQLGDLITALTRLLFHALRSHCIQDFTYALASK